MIHKSTKDGRGKGSHYHYLYIKTDANGEEIVTVSLNRKHRHEYEAGRLLEENSHTHEIAEPIFSEVELPNEKDDDVVRDVRQLWKLAKEEEREYRKEAKQAEDFYSGDQWDDADKQKLEGEDRAPLTINEIEGKMDLLSGYQRNNRTDIRFLPIEGGDDRVADILNLVVKNILRQNNFKFEETDGFEDEMITGRGNLNVGVTYDNHIEGDIVIEQWPWEEARYGQHKKKDLSDCEYLDKEKWLSWAKIKTMWPDKKDEIQKEIDFYDKPELEREPIIDHYAHGENILPPTRDIDFVDIGKKQYRTIEMWRKVYTRNYVALNALDNFYQKIDVPKNDIEQIKSLGLNVIPRVQTNMRVSIIAGGVLLDDSIDDMFDDIFPLIPMYAKKRGGKIWGKVKALIDPQREGNKRISQFMDIVNRMAGYGWFTDSETFENTSDEHHFKKISAKSGFIQKIRTILKPPLKVEGTKVPVEIVSMVQVMSDKGKEISNINQDLLGQRSDAKSGIAILHRQQQGLLGNNFLFDNMSLAKRNLGRILIKLIQKLYTPERIVRIIGNKSQAGEAKIGPNAVKNLTPKNMQEILIILKEQDLSRYDVAIDESANNPTTRRANFITWTEMAKQGIPVPPSVLVELSDLPQKDIVKTAIEAQQAAHAQIELGKQQTEIIKSSK
jgi:hypothetical protein